MVASGIENRNIPDEVRKYTHEKWKKHNKLSFMCKIMYHLHVYTYLALLKDLSNPGKVQNGDGGHKSSTLTEDQQTAMKRMEGGVEEACHNETTSREAEVE